MEKLHVKERGDDWMMQSFRSEQSEWQITQEINDLTAEHANSVLESIEEPDRFGAEAKERLQEEIVYPEIDAKESQINEKVKPDLQDCRLNQYELPKESLAQALILNQDIQCDGCFAFPIVGTIFKCLACPNYDLCSKCEPHTHIHHPFLKVAHPHHYPITTDVVFSRKSYREMQEQERQNKKAEAETIALLKKQA